MRALVEQGADKEKASNDGQTPLHLAASYFHLNVVSFLVEQGADKEKTNNNGETPLHLAARDLYDSVNHVGGRRDYDNHVGGRRLEVVRYLLEQGADRDKANNDGNTPLHLAAGGWDGRLEIVKLLMVYGADLNARNNRGELPIDVARNEAIKQAIRDEPRRRLDHGHKRATEQDRHPNAATSASAQQEEEEGEDMQSNKRPRLGEGVAEAGEGKVAEEDEDSEPSSHEEDDA